jgi:GntR family transcriptional regulator/MocR family aminotransferase
LAEISRPGPTAALPLHRRLYEAMRRAMLDGKLTAGDRLPSSRDLAQDLDLSRNTVVAALGQLMVEGYLVSRVGSGTYVHDQVPLPSLAKGPRPQAHDGWGLAALVLAAVHQAGHALDQGATLVAGAQVGHAGLRRRA